MRHRLVATALFLLLSTAAARASDLDPLVGVLPADERAAIDGAFYETEPFLDGDAIVRRTSADAFKKMREVAAARPQSAAAQAYLAEAAWAAGDFTAAEAAWKQAAALSGRAPWTLWQLARFYEVRLEPDKAVAVLDELAELTRAKLAAEPTRREELRDTYNRILELARVHALSTDVKKVRRAIVELYPDEPYVLRAWLDEYALTASAKDVRAEADRFRKLFPGEGRAFARAEAAALTRDGKIDDAVAVYRKLLAADPTADDAEDRYRDFYDLLRRAGRLSAEEKALETRARSGASADLAALVWLHLNNGNVRAARTALDGARATAAPATAQDTLIRARLHLRAGDPGQAIRYYFAAYAGAKGDGDRQSAIAELGIALLADGAPRSALTPLDPLDAFALDRLATGPSLPGGVASLVFDGAEAPDATRVATLYLNTVRAEQMLAEARKQWPKSRKVARLAASILVVWRAYERHDAVANLAAEYLKAWPDGEDATAVAMAGARALRAKKDVAGSDKAWREALARAEKRSTAEADRVLDEYASVLLAERRPLDVVALHWERIERRPRDPRPYDRMIAFLDDVRLFDEELKVYKKALERFGDASWQHRIARWHLRHKGEASFRDLTKQLMQTLSGSEAELYLSQLVYDDYSVDETDKSRFYEAVYKMALDRFPYRVQFVQRLLYHYDRYKKRGKDAAALTRKYAALDPSIRQRLLLSLGEARKLDATLAQVGGARRASPGGGRSEAEPQLQKPRGRAEKLLRADLLVWLSRQEQALPLAIDLAADWPEDPALARRAANLIIATSTTTGIPGDSAKAKQAAAHLDRMTNYYPAMPEFADEAGMIFAEAGELAEAKKRWERYVLARKGDEQSYVKLAGALWDYYLYDEAESAFHRARKVTKDPLLFWDKMGGVYESRRDFAKAAGEYARAYVDEVGRGLAGGPSGGGYEPSGYGEYDESGEYSEYEYEGEGGYGWNLAHGAQTTAEARLLDFTRKRGRDAIATALDGLADKDRRALLAKARWLRLAGQGDAARQTLLAAIPKFSGDALLFAAASDALAERWHDVAVLALERRADLGGGTPDLVYPLADALETAGEPKRAEAKYKTLIASLDKAGDVGVGARQVYAAFLFRRGKDREDDAFTILREAAGRAPEGAARDALLYDTAWRALERKRHKDAEALLTDLRRRNPRDLRYVEGLAELLARSKPGDAAALRAHYDAAIADAKSLAGAGAGERSAQVAEIRRSYLARLEAAGLHVDAIDQWIEILNRDAEDDATLQGAIAYARRNGQIDRLVTYYTRTADKSPKDARWPLVLAAIHESTGKPGDAAGQLARAISIRPEQVHLYEWRGRALLAAADYAGAEQAFARGYALSDQDWRWLLWIARAQARQGKDAELQKTLESYVSAGGGRVVAAGILSGAGLEAEAHALLGRGIEAALADPYNVQVGSDVATAFLETGVRAGKGVDAAQALESVHERLEQAVNDDNVGSWIDDSSLSGVSAARQRLLVFVADQALDADGRALMPFVEKSLATSDDYTAERLVERVADRLPELTLAVIESRRKLHGSDEWQRERWDGALIEFHEKRGADRALLALFAADKSLHTAAFLPSAAAAARRVGDGALEKQYLAAWWTDEAAGVDPADDYAPRQGSQYVTRYLELLRATGDRKGLEAVAERGGYAAEQVANWLFAAGEVDLALRAIAAVGRAQSQPPVWRKSRQAAALAAFGDTADRTQLLFQESLGRRTIGAHEKGALPDSEALIGDDWYRLAGVYGKVLAKAQPAGVRIEDYAFAAIEDHPLNGGAQVSVGRIYLARKDFARAATHFELALVLAPGDVTALDGLGAAKLGLGDKTAALAAWERIRSRPNAGDREHVLYVEALARAGLRDEARAAARQRLEARYLDASPGEGGALIDTLIAQYEASDRGAGGPVDQILRRLEAKGKRPWLYEKVLGFALPAYDPWGGGDSYREREYEYDEEGEWSGRGYESSYEWFPTMTPLLDADALDPYYRAAVALARGNGKATTDWQRAYVTLLLGQDKLKQAGRVVDEAMAEWQAAQPGSEPPFWLALARAEVQLADAKADPVPALSKALLASPGLTQLRQGVDMLVRRDKKAMAARLTLAFHEWRGGAAPSFEDAIAMAGARLELGELARALATLEALIAMAPEDPAGYLASAGALEAAGKFSEAQRIRQRLARLAPGDAANRLGLALDAQAAGDGSTAIGVASSLLGDRRADRATRDKAAALIADAVAAKGDLAGRAVETVSARAETTPFDSATFVALAAAHRAAGNGGKADAALGKAMGGLAPAAAALALGKARLAAGDPAKAEAAFEKAVELTAGSADARRALFAARRKAARHAGAIGALEDGRLTAYRNSGAGGSGKDARKRLVDAELAAGATLAHASDAADSAESAKDWMAAAYFRSLAARLAANDKDAQAQRGKAAAHLQKALVLERRAIRDYVNLADVGGEVQP